jgi:N-acyl-D-aspartate/D-glutamate deacylase
MAEQCVECGFEFELIIRGGFVIDGSGAPRRRLDVGIAAGRIAALEPTLDVAKAAKVIEAEGLIVAPGFIDVHTHDDNSLLDTPDMVYKTSQGVTTVVAGNCGISLAPFTRPADGSRDSQGEVIPPLNLLGSTFAYPTLGSLFDAMDAAPAAVNALVLCGHTTLRIGVMGPAAMERAATASELASMQVMLQEALDAGAIGLSTGLAYASAIEATTEEVIGLARLLRPAGALCEYCVLTHSIRFCNRLPPI